MSNSKPNFIVVFADNLGYGDLGCYGSTLHRTPHVDRIAEEGVRFTSFYSTSGVCTPSRASLMTGCYPRRVNMHVSPTGRAVLQPMQPKGLHPEEETIARFLQRQGYATACIGKWHLGDQIPFLPTRHGFDYYFGLPYSDDMTPRPQFPEWPPLPLMRNEQVIEAPVDRDYLTRRLTEETIGFIRENHDRPFFVYLPQAMPGSTDRPFASPEFQGRSTNGPYGDSVEEMDWSTGEILDTVQELGLDDNTLIIWTSDNGAARHDPLQGSNAPLKGWGYDTSEGGMRVPCLARWPGRIAPGTETDEVMTTMDVLPTLAALAGAPLPERPLDGHDMRHLLSCEGAVSPYDEEGFLYYFMDQLQAVRSGPWKLYLPLEAKSFWRGDVKPSDAELFNLRDDISENHEVSAEHPEVVARLMEMAERGRHELGDRDRDGVGQREAGCVEDPTPRVLES